MPKNPIPHIGEHIKNHSVPGSPPFQHFHNPKYTLRLIFLGHRHHSCPIRQHLHYHMSAPFSHLCQLCILLHRLYPHQFLLTPPQNFHLQVPFPVPFYPRQDCIILINGDKFHAPYLVLCCIRAALYLMPLGLHHTSNDSRLEWQGLQHQPISLFHGLRTRNGWHS